MARTKAKKGVQADDDQFVATSSFKIGPLPKK